MYFSCIGNHIISYIANFGPLVRGEIKKKRNLSREQVGPIEIVWGSKLSLNFAQGVNWTK